MMSKNYYEDNFVDKVERDNLILGLVDNTDYKDECEKLRAGRGVIPNFFFYVISQLLDISCVVYNVDDSSKYPHINKPNEKILLLDGIVPQDVVLFNFQVVCTQFQIFNNMAKKSFVTNKVLHYNIVNVTHSNVLGATDEDKNMEKIALHPYIIHNLLNHPKTILDVNPPATQKEIPQTKKIRL